MNFGMRVGIGIGAHMGCGPKGTIDAYLAAVLADSPVALWRLGESSGTTAADSSGAGLNGTYVGGYTLGQAGAVIGNTAALFNGTTGYVNVGNQAAYNLTTAFTVEFWVKLTSIPTQAWAIGKDTDTGRSYCVGFNNGSLTIQVGGVPMGEVASPFTADGLWHHCAITFDNANYRFYVDGVPAGVGSSTPPTVTATQLLLARRGYPGFEGGFPGALDEVALYSSTLSAARIAAHYAARS